MINKAQDDFFNELYASTNQKVLAYIIVKCGKTEDVADIFQETYTEVVKIIRKHGISYFKQPDALVMQIAKRKIFRHYKLKEKLRGKEEMNYYLYYYMDKNISEIALLFSVKESTIKNRLYRTLRELRQNLDKED